MNSLEQRSIPVLDEIRREVERVVETHQKAGVSEEELSQISESERERYEEEFAENLSLADPHKLTTDLEILNKLMIKSSCTDTFDRSEMAGKGLEDWILDFIFHSGEKKPELQIIIFIYKLIKLVSRVLHDLKHEDMNRIIKREVINCLKTQIIPDHEDFLSKIRREIASVKHLRTQLESASIKEDSIKSRFEKIYQENPSKCTQIIADASHKLTLADTKTINTFMNWLKKLVEYADEAKALRRFAMIDLFELKDVIEKGGQKIDKKKVRIVLEYLEARLKEVGPKEPTQTP